MKREIILWVVIAALVAGALILSAVLPKEQPMAIDFETSSYPQYINFGEMDALKGLTQKTICAWVKPESLSTYQHIFNINTQLENNPYDFSKRGGYQLMLSDGKIRFTACWTGATDRVAAWDSVGSVSAGSVALLCAVYDASSALNDPVFYLNGSSSGVSEIQAPSSALLDYATGYTPTTKIGLSHDSSVTQFDGIVHKVMVYDRILSAEEIAEMYGSRGARIPRKGLVFCPVLYGARGLQAFDGATLTADNKIVDPCSGVIGTPVGSPVAIGENYLSLK